MVWYLVWPVWRGRLVMSRLTKNRFQPNFRHNIPRIQDVYKNKLPSKKWKGTQRRTLYLIRPNSHFHTYLDHYLQHKERIELLELSWCLLLLLATPCSENTLVACIGSTNSVVKVIVSSKAKNPGVQSNNSKFIKFTDGQSHLFIFFAFR
jgi:hypothetical protein